MKKTIKNLKRQLFTQSSFKTITTTLVLCILICSGAIVSSGVCSTTNTIMQEQQKILTRKDSGLLLLSLSLSKDSEQRLFLQQTLQQLTLKGEITEDELQSIASQFQSISDVYLLCNIEVDNGIGSAGSPVLPIPGLIITFIGGPIISLFISAYGKIIIDGTSHSYCPVTIIGFIGTAFNWKARNVWRYSVEGNCLICILKNKEIGRKEVEYNE